MPDLHPGDGNYRVLHRYWTVGAGGAKIRWGTHHDWTRCVELLSKHVGIEQAKRQCNIYHHEMTGMYPGDKRNK